MDKKDLRRYRSNKRELALTEKRIEKLYERLESVPEISGKVTKSSDEFPYIEERITVKMDEPKEAAMIKEQIRQKELRRQELTEMIETVETFISTLPEGEDKRIFELTYLEGMRQQEVADEIGYSRGRISQKLSQYLKD